MHDSKWKMINWIAVFQQIHGRVTYTTGRHQILLLLQCSCLSPCACPCQDVLLCTSITQNKVPSFGFDTVTPGAKDVCQVWCIACALMNGHDIPHERQESDMYTAAFWKFESLYPNTFFKFQKFVNQRLHNMTYRGHIRFVRSRYESGNQCVPNKVSCRRWQIWAV